MLKDSNIEITVKYASYEHYISLGYDIKINDKIIIPSYHLSKGSTKKVEVICDNCGECKFIKYQDYIKSLKDNSYYCIKCNRIRYKQTCLEKYGIENTFMCDDVKNKTLNTKKEKYGNINYNNREKYKQTCLKKYGVSNPHKNEIVKNKAKQTCLEKYGTENSSQNEDVKNKAKQTCLEKYGNICSLHGDEIKTKVINSLIIKYGVDNAMKNINIFKKSMNSGLKTKKFNEYITYQGTYELDFLNKYYNNIKIENGKTVKILFNNNETYYHSDFYLPEYNLIVEIKSSYWYEKYFDKNKVKEKTCKELGYNFIFIINKKYDEFDNFITY